MVEPTAANPPPHRHGRVAVPSGLILLVGPPAAGKSSFARAWVSRGQIDADGVVSCDAIRAELFGARVRLADDAVVFAEMDSRVANRLAAARPVIIDATNVRRPARTRMIDWARQYGRTVTALLFRVQGDVLLRRNAARTGQARVPAEDVLRYAAIAAHTSRDRLLAEGVDVVVDVPGEAEGASPSDAAQAIHLDRCLPIQRMRLR
jgi:predicted kinase